MLQLGTRLGYASPRGHRSGGCLCLCAGDLPPVAVEIAEKKGSVFAACFDLFEIFDFPSPAIGLKRTVSVVHGIDRIHRQCETLIAGEMLAVLLERLNTDHVPRCGGMFYITRAGPQLHHFETKYFAVEALRSLEILVFQSAMGKGLGNVALARKLSVGSGWFQCGFVVFPMPVSTACS